LFKARDATDLVEHDGGRHAEALLSGVRLLATVGFGADAVDAELVDEGHADRQDRGRVWRLRPRFPELAVDMGLRGALFQEKRERDVQRRRIFGLCRRELVRASLCPSAHGCDDVDGGIDHAITIVSEEERLQEATKASVEVGVVLEVLICPALSRGYSRPGSALAVKLGGKGDVRPEGLVQALEALVGVARLDDVVELWPYSLSFRKHEPASYAPASNCVPLSSV
jgi:hypothetical protein